MSFYLPIGNKGSGKTSLLAYNAGRDDRPFYSNFHIDSKRYHPLDLETMQDVNRALICGDEWTAIVANARTSMSKGNIAAAWILDMSRKSKVDFQCSTQLLRKLDVLWRDQADFLIMCTREDDNMIDGDFVYIMYKNAEWHPRVIKRKIRYDWMLEHVFPYYDTDQKIHLPDELRRLSFDRNKHLDEIKKASDTLLMSKEVTPREVSMAMVKDFCRKNDLHSGFEEPIYVEIKGRK